MLKCSFGFQTSDIYHLYVLEKVKRGQERARAKGAISHEDAKARLGKWLAS